MFSSWIFQARLVTRGYESPWDFTLNKPNSWVRNVSDVADIEPTHNDDADIDAKHDNG